jgi:hypothetical protein
MDPYKRIGKALSKPRSSDRRQDAYGIWESKEFGTLYVKYEGYQLPNGSMLGLPGSGMHASFNQSLHKVETGKVFDLATFAEVTFFDGRDLASVLARL